jgi:putative ABC transport system substrate-binding protein
LYRFAIVALAWRFAPVSMSAQRIDSVRICLSRPVAKHNLIVLPEATTNARSELIIAMAARYRLPTIYAYRYQANGGGLISYGVDLADSFRGAAVYVDRILRGEKPADLPAQSPIRFTLVVNMTTATALGLTVPTMTLLRADDVIE